MDTSKYEDLFISESEEYIEQISSALLDLEKNSESTESVNVIFRAMHTLKGMAASMGYIEISQIAHGLEDVMDMIRGGTLQLSNELTDLLLKGNDYIDALVHKKNIDPGVIKSFRHVLESIKAGSKAFENTEQSKTANPAAPKIDPENSFTIEVIFSDDVMLKSARAFVVVKAAKDRGVFAKTEPDMDAVMREEFDKSFLLCLTSGDSANSLVEEIKKIPEIKDAILRKTEKKDETQEEKSGQRKDIKVSLERLDNLQNYASELVIARGRLQQIAYSTQNEELINALNSTSKIITNIQDEVMKIRMVPVWQIFDRYPRYIRDLSNKLNKKIDFIVKGRDIELDRALLNALADPLLHLLRNSIDHGIERSEERRAKRKKETGTIVLEAKRLKNAIIIEVSDDGKGLDTERILKKALERGLISEEHAKNLTQTDIFHFITQSGFSTKDEVSDVSGRGVGVDAVKSVLKQMGGSFEISSEKDRGTTFTLKVPLTLAIIKTLQVNVGSEVYIIPLTHIIETIDIKDEEIQSIMGREVFILRDQLIPIIRVSDIYKVKMNEKKTDYSIVLVEVDDSQYGILVDEFVEQSEVVVKSLRGMLSGIQGLAGVTILNNGMPSFIVDVPGLLQMAKVG
ncbi:MAG: chemotaxis protein CheA [bacterium]|nr:chemotaxis protein CheA [bacterium]